MGPLKLVFSTLFSQKCFATTWKTLFTRNAHQEICNTVVYKCVILTFQCFRRKNNQLAHVKFTRLPLTMSYIKYIPLTVHIFFSTPQLWCHSNTGVFINSHGYACNDVLYITVFSYLIFSSRKGQFCFFGPEIHQMPQLVLNLPIYITGNNKYILSHICIVIYTLYVIIMIWHILSLFLV